MFLLSQIQMTNSVASNQALHRIQVSNSVAQQSAPRPTGNSKQQTPAPSDFSSSVLHNHKLKYYLQTETSKKK